MFNINWKIRFMNKTWVIAFIAAIFVLITAIGKLFGFELDLSNIQGNIVDIVYAVFGVIAVIGITMDPTTAGINDSPRAMEYDVPGKFTGKADEVEDEE